MTTPREIIRQANGRRKIVQPAAPTPSANEPALPERVVVPQPIRQNSVYHQLMRSHDRMHTRHLQG